jgi:chromosomal replication initiator protein
MHNVDDIWGRAIAFTRSKSTSFEQWFAGVQFDGLSDGVLSLRARDEWVREWVDQHFMPTLADHLRSETGWSIQVAWTIDGELDQPVVREPSPPSVRPRPLNTRSTWTTSIPSAPQLTPSLAALVSDDPPLASPGAGTPEGASSPRSSPPPAAILGRHLAAVPAAIPGLNPKFTFAKFVIGPSNQLAHAASVATAGGTGPRYNPLFICGGTGLGKTHLVHAVAHRVLAERPSARILYVSAEKFINEFVEALKDQKMGEFRARYRDKCDLLLVDDIQFLASKTQTQEEFFHVFNALHQAQKPIIVTSDKYPQQLERMEERLISRFSSGLVADIQPPELETRVAILRKKAEIEGLELDDAVMIYIAQVVRSNVRELEGTLIRLAAKASLIGRPIDIDFARQEIAAAAGTRINEASVEDIQRVVCHHFKLRSGDLLSKDRHKSIAFARHVAMYLCKQRLKSSFPEIGRAFGNRDHTTVMAAVKKVGVLRTTDAETRAHLEVLEKKLGTE